MKMIKRRMSKNHPLFFYIIDKRIVMKYFSIDEMVRSATAKKYGIDNRPSQDILNNLVLFIEKVLDPIREDWGSPISVSSGYRCPELNAKVGGAKTSGHQYGFCADLQVKGDLRKFSCFVKDWMKKHKMSFDELLYESSGGVTWLHFCWIGKDGKQRMKCFDIIK